MSHNDEPAPISASTIIYAVDRLADELCHGRRERVRIATQFLAGIVWDNGDEDFRGDCRRALEWADILLEEADK